MSICKSGVKGYQAQAVPFSPIRVLTLLRLPPLPPSPLLIHSFPILAGPAHPRANKSSSQLELALALTPTLPHLFFFFFFRFYFPWMAAVLPNTGFDFSSSSQPLHSRSASMSSASSPRSRPQSSHGPSQLGLRPSVDEYFTHPTSFANPEHARNNSDASHSSAYSLGSDLVTPADSPPNHNLANPALGKTLLRPTHIRARVAASPYPRDTESVHSSSSETEDISMFLSHSAQDQYHSAQAFVNPHHPHPQPPHGSHHLSHHPHPHQHLAQQTMHVPGAFGSLPGPGSGGHGRMGMGAATDHTLEKLAANVRAATTTSASDRAKQIFVQAWCVFSWTLGYCLGPFFFFSSRRLMLILLSFCLAVDVFVGSHRTTLPTPMATSLGRGSISRTEGFATSMEYPTSIPPLWERPLDFVFQLSRLGAWASEGTVNITVSSTLDSLPSSHLILPPSRQIPSFLCFVPFLFSPLGLFFFDRSVRVMMLIATFSFLFLCFMSGISRLRDPPRHFGRSRIPPRLHS